VLASSLILVRCEGAAEERRDAEDAEEFRRHHGAGQLFRLAGPGQVRVPPRHHREPLENIRALADVSVGRHRETRFEVVQRRIEVIERDQPLRLIVGQRPE
jgi:hypothetical protein